MAEPKDDKPVKPGDRAADPREARLAAALRTNLRRRKAPGGPTGGAGDASTG